MHKTRIAIIGSGISGLTAAHYLHSQCDIEIFEKNDYVGGHTHTHDVQVAGKTYPVNTGFIVYNDWVYKNFNKILASLDVEREPTKMSFSVRDENSGLEYCGNTIDSLFAQRKNLISPSFHKMVLDILRFNRVSQQDLERNRLSETLTLRDYFEQHKFGKNFINQYIVPMGAAIWSSGEAKMLDFPALFFIRFFKNHGLLSVTNRPQWYVLKGGSRSYIEPLIEPFKHKIHLNSNIRTVKRFEEHVTLLFDNGDTKTFDEVIFACHSDQALALLNDPTNTEKDILSSIPYAKNEVVLHTDERLLPTRKKAWGAWNYHLTGDQEKLPALTYNMNILQNFQQAPVTFCVTLNNSQAIDPDKIIARFEYDHPIFGQGSVSSQARYHDIGNKNQTHFCGAYWFNGFHEDGVNSALRVVEDITKRIRARTENPEQVENVLA